MPISDWLSSNEFWTAEAKGTFKEGAHQLLFGRKFKHRVIDTVLLAALPLLLPAVGGLVTSLPRMLSQDAETRKMMRDGVKDLQTRLLQKLKNDVHLHMELHASGDEAERNAKERAARGFLRAFDAAVVTKLQHAQTEREALVAWNAIFKCLEANVPCEALSKKEGTDLRLAYGKLEPDVQKIVREAVAHVRRDYRSLLRRAAALAAALATLAVCYAVAPQDWTRKSPGEILADQALADGKTPSEVQAAHDKWSKDLDDLRAANNKEREEAGIRERKLAEQIRALEAKDQEASASNLQALKTSTANQRAQAEALREKLERLIEAQKAGSPPTAMESATLLQSLMPNSMMGALSTILMLGSLPTMGLVNIYRSRAANAASAQKSTLHRAAATLSVFSEKDEPIVLPPSMSPAEIEARRAAVSSAVNAAAAELHQQQERLAETVIEDAIKKANESRTAIKVQAAFRGFAARRKKVAKDRADTELQTASPDRARSAEKAGASSRTRSSSSTSSVASLDSTELDAMPTDALAEYAERKENKALKLLKKHIKNKNR